LAILQAVAFARTVQHKTFINNNIQGIFNCNATQRKAEKLKTNSHQNGHQDQRQIFLNVYAGIAQGRLQLVAV